MARTECYFFRRATADDGGRLAIFCDRIEPDGDGARFSGRLRFGTLRGVIGEGDEMLFCCESFHGNAQAPDGFLTIHRACAVQDPAEIDLDEIESAAEAIPEPPSSPTHLQPPAEPLIFRGRNVHVVEMPPWQARVVQEAVDLQHRIHRLDEFLRSDEFSARPVAERELLVRQRGIMQEYRDVLGKRIATFIPF